MIVRGDARYIPLRDNSVQVVCTSPPYWGLRKYSGAQELIWGGDEKCEHDFRKIEGPKITQYTGEKKRWEHGPGEVNPTRECVQARMGDSCACGAWRGAYGLEPTVEMYVQHSVEILREIRRVLRPDGVVFWNIGDSYSGSGKGIGSDHGKAVFSDDHITKTKWNGVGLKPKDLCLVPQRIALTAQQDGWWVRSDIIWAKPNPMPESCKDRPTDSYEHILMLTKSARYYWDAEAVKEQLQDSTLDRNRYHRGRSQNGGGSRESMAGYDYARRDDLGNMTCSGGRNCRNVWTFATQPFSGDELCGRYRITSPDCPVHGYLASRARAQQGGEQRDALPIDHNQRSGSGLFLGQVASDAAIPENQFGFPFHESFASDRNNEIHKSDSLSEQGGISGGKSVCRSEYMESLDRSDATYDHISENKILEDYALDDSETNLSVENPGRNGDISSCICTWNMEGCQDHFAVFPEEIPRRCIKAASRPGDLILDPFGGSGTTARVATELNRRALSLDLAYQSLSMKRTSHVQRVLLGL